MIGKHKFFLDRVVPLVLWLIFFAVVFLLLFAGVSLFVSVVTGDKQALLQVVGTSNSGLYDPVRDPAMTGVVVQGFLFSMFLCLLGGLGAYVLYRLGVAQNMK